MKKRLIALILAGLLTASLASCTTESGRGDDDTSYGGTEAEQTRGEDVTDPPVTVTWNEVDETVYVLAKDGMTLTEVNGGGTVSATMGEALHRVKVSNTARSVVEKDGKQYYADSTKLTTDDITGAGFTDAADKPTRYINAKDGGNVRAFATTAAKIVTTLELNAQVKLLATGTVGTMNWSKVELTVKDETVIGFVASSLLSEQETVDPDTVDYSQYFTACEETEMFVSAGSLNLRKNASDKSSLVINLVKGDKVIVVANGEIDGTKWSKVKVPKKLEFVGQTQTYHIGYVASRYLTDKLLEEDATLEDMLAFYTDFTKKEPAVSMYVSNKITAMNIRTTPYFGQDAGNTSGIYLEAKEQVTVVASGFVEDVFVAMIEYKNEDKTCYGFVNEKNLTPDPEGTPIQMLPELIKDYGFTLVEEKEMVAKQTVLLNLTPEKAGTETIEKDTKVTVYATGTYDGADWYIFKVEGKAFYYFAGVNFFAELEA